MSRSRCIRSASLIGALALVGALMLPAAAQAAPVDDVLVFSNGAVVDLVDDSVGEAEYLQISAAITAAGYNVIPFDGGDGQAATWSAALAGVDVFVLPEQEAGAFYEPNNPPAWLSAAAMDVLIDWIHAGGTLLASGACLDDQGGTAYLLSQAVGVNYQGSLGNCGEPGVSTRWIDDSGLPATLDDANGSYPIALATFSPAQRAPLTVWYSSGESCSEQLTVGEFAAGSGRVAFEAWDYFNDPDNDQLAWNAVLASLLSGNTAVSTWEPPAAPMPPAPVTAVTATGQKLYTISEFGCANGNVLFRVDPGTAKAAPVSGTSVRGEVGQGAVSPATGIAYVPFGSYDSDKLLLLTVDTASGAFTHVGEFSAADDLEIYWVYSIAIAADGSAYAFAVYEGDGSDVLGLFSLNLSDASLTFISEVDDEQLDEPNGFAVNPKNGKFYAFEEDSHELFEVNVQNGALTSLGFLAAPSIVERSDVTALQVGQDGTFWVVFDVQIDDEGGDAGVLATFTLADIVDGDVNAHEVGILTDDPLESYSLLLGATELAATGVDTASTAGGALFAGALLLLGTALVAVRRSRRRAA